MDFPCVSADKTHHVFEGMPIYDARFSEVREYCLPGIAAVCDESGAYHIDFFGKPLYTERYEAVGDFSDSTAWVKDAGGYFYIDENGSRINSETYTYAADFCDRTAAVYHAFCGATHITTAGEMLYNDWYYDVRSFEDGTALVRDDEGWHRINKGGEILSAAEAPEDDLPKGSIRIPPRQNRIAELLAGRTYDSAVILIRHAEREPFYRGEPGVGKLVTVRGEKTAAAFGAQLPGIDAAYASPMPRCMRTAELIAGFSPQEDSMLGEPSAFIFDNAKSSAFYLTTSTATAVRSYIKGAELPGHYPIAEGAARLLSHLKSAGTSGLTLCVTHDLFSASFIGAVTGYDFAADWVDFMDGCVLLRNGDEWRLVWREGEVILP
ncbi:MAG: histidine phosphatase family protein [Methanocorpusculum sp.]|nr:histidine phosphatase family protein [Methanocorpusculum sp.]